jgi:hypothetical protein
MGDETVDPISAAADLLDERLDPVPAFGHELPDDQDALMPFKCVVVAGAGGPGAGGFLPNGKQRLDVKSYGATHAEAMDVAITAHNVLKRLRRTVVGTVLIRSFEPSSGYLTLRDANARWPLVLRSYIESYDERAVA